MTLFDGSNRSSVSANYNICNVDIVLRKNKLYISYKDQKTVEIQLFKY